MLCRQSADPKGNCKYATAVRSEAATADNASYCLKLSEVFLQRTCIPVSMSGCKATSGVMMVSVSPLCRMSMSLKQGCIINVEFAMPDGRRNKNQVIFQ